MSQGSLARTLSQLDRFDNPKLELEQYATPGEIAANLIWIAHLQGDLEGKRVVDLGAGTGVLGIGALILRAYVTFVEIDPDALAILKRNLEGYDNYEIIEADISSFEGTYDTVIMNPPFGAQKRHADRAFLERAFASAPTTYSIHNANSTSFLRSLCNDHKRSFDILGEASLDLPAAFPHHTKPRVKQSVILCRSANV